MTDRMDADLLREYSPNSAASSEIDVATLPWLMPDDPAPAPAEFGAAPATPRASLPPPRRPRATANSHPKAIIGGAAAGLDTEAPVTPGRIITTPRPSPSTLRNPLPSIIIPRAASSTDDGRYLGETLPPRNRAEAPGRELLAEPTAERDGGPVAKHPARTLIAVSVVAIVSASLTPSFGASRPVQAGLAEFTPRGR